jgi:hypothetical protein
MTFQTGSVSIFGWMRYEDIFTLLGHLVELPSFSVTSRVLVRNCATFLKD